MAQMSQTEGGVNIAELLEEWSEQLVKQALEIERLRFALYGCLVASKRIDPMDYAGSLAFIHEESHNALYGDTVEFVALERPLATHFWKETER